MTVIDQNRDFLQKVDFENLLKEVPMRGEDGYLVRYLVLMLDKSDGHFLKIDSSIYDLPNMLAATISIKEPMKEKDGRILKLLGGLSEDLTPELEGIVTRSLESYNHK